MRRTVLRVWADDAAEMARAIQAHDPAWRAETFHLAGGRAVLWGAGLYVNRAMAAGLGTPFADEDLDRLEERSAAVGVDAAVEVTDATSTQATELLAARGYHEMAGRRVSALRFEPHLDEIDSLVPVDTAFLLEPAGARLATWQDVSAAGWEHATDSSRRASDAFARAAAAVDGTTLFLIRDAASRRPIGCATMSIRDGVATLGGMSTVPAMRARGVQSAAIHQRLRIAAAAGCDVAATTTATGSASERNLRRHGFESWFEIRTLTRSAAPGRQ